MHPTDHPLQPAVAKWMEKIHLAMDYKRKRFGRDAEEGMKFLTGPYHWLYSQRGGSDLHFRSPDGEDMPSPSFQMTLNKAAELVQLFGPALYHRNPVRQVNPRKFPPVPPDLFGPVAQDPVAAQQYQAYLAQDQQALAMDRGRADLLAAYLNYTPFALDLKTESRWAIDEAMIKGMGCLWQERYTPPGARHTMVGSFYDTVDNLVIDPDMESLRDAKWVARRCVHPVWEVERLYGLPPGTVRGNMESLDQRAAVAADPVGDYLRKTGQTNDLLVYWKVYSKMGMGGRLSGVAQHLRDPLDQFGDYCFLAVCEECPYPLNLPPAMIDAAGGVQQIQQAVQWETPFWAGGGWPFAPIAFHWVPRDPWPMSHLAPGMGELKFLNWLYSFIASKIAVTCRDFIAMKKSLGDEVKSRILGGKDLTLLEIEEEHGSITDVVGFLTHPQFNGDIWAVAQAVMEQFERRVGLNELMYGESSRQLRSATEADIKQGQMNVRPDDMANKVEDAMGLAAQNEAIACRWHLRPQDVQAALGPAAAAAWGQLVYATDPSVVIHQLEYRIEAGSARKPNRDRDAANMKDAMQTLFQPLWGYAAQTGDVRPVNALIADWAKAIDLDADKYLIAPPPMPQPTPGGPPPEQQPAA